MTDKRNVYGWVNGEAVYTAEDFRYKARGFGAITNDDDLMAYAEKVTYGCQTRHGSNSCTVRSLRNR